MLVNWLVSHKYTPKFSEWAQSFEFKVYIRTKIVIIIENNQLKLQIFRSQLSKFLLIFIINKSIDISYGKTKADDFANYDTKPSAMLLNSQLSNHFTINFDVIEPTSVSTFTI